MSVLQAVQKLIAENPVMVFSGTYCPYCTKAKKYLTQAGAQMNVVEIDKHPEGDAMLQALSKHVTQWDTVPQVFIKGKFIGGGDDTESKFKSGELQKMLA